MPSPEQNSETVRSYLGLVAKGDADGVAALYADDATVEDPVGTDVHIGRQAIRGFYENIVTVRAATDVITLRALGHEAAFFWTLTLDLGESKLSIEIISTMTFDPDGKIASMKAYWGPEDMKPV